MLNDTNRTVENYRQIRPLYESYCLEIKRIIYESFKESGISVHTIEARAKSIESFERKCLKTDDSGNPRYSNALTEITDLAAVRIITYTLSEMKSACNAIERMFDIDQKKDVGEERIEQGKFGYQSIHFLVKLTKERTNFLDSRRYKDLICEIQVRTVLQHAWAEIEHDIQYKSSADLPKTIERKFLSLAGLLEIADREFQAIQDEDAKLKASVIEDLRDELTRESLEATSEPSKPQKRADPEASNSVVSVRDLIIQKRYEEAVKIYDTKIDKTPNMDTLYLGRAKAKFLMGDSSGAVEDVRRALSLNPNSTPAKELISLMLEGSKNRETPTGAEANDLTKKGNELLESGNGIGAYENYALAQAAGASRPFSTFNKAMACVVASDFSGGRDHLTTLQPRSGTPMAINVQALECIIGVLEKSEDIDGGLEKLKLLTSELGDYSFQMSPLKKLENAFRSQGKLLNKSIEKVFEILKQ